LRGPIRGVPERPARYRELVIRTDVIDVSTSTVSRAEGLSSHLDGSVSRM